MELGIPAESIEAAEAEVERRRKEVEAEREQKALRTKFEHYYRSKSWGELGSTFSSCLAILAIWWITGHGYFWPLWVLPWIALAGVSQLFGAIFGGPNKERRYQRWLEKQGKRAARASVSEADGRGISGKRAQVDISLHLGGPSVIITGVDNGTNQKQEIN